MFDLFLGALATALVVRWWAIVAGALVHLLRAAPPVPEVVDADVALLVPAYNESRVLAGTVASALASDHARLQIVLIDDGSTDDTWAVAQELARTHAHVHAVQMPQNGGKAAALQLGLRSTEASFIVTVDADTILAPDAIRTLAARLLDGTTAAVAGNVKVGNRDRALTRWQNVEYITALHVDRRALDTLGCVTTVPGAAGAWRREAVLAAGGWTTDTRTEDTDLTLAMLRRGERIVFEPRAVAWTEAPTSLGDLLRQRTRWMFGYLQCIWKHRAAFLTPTMLGVFGMPNLAYAHFIVFLLPVPGWLAADRVWTLSGGVEPLVAGTAIYLFGEILLSGWAYLVDGEDLHELAHVPGQRLFWPFLLSATFVHVWLRILSGSQVPWWSPQRQGVLADRTVAQHPDER